MPDATPFHVSVDASGPTSGVATLTLEQGDRPVVVLDLALIQRLEATLRSLPHGILGLVVVSAAPRAFVAGADLRSITELDDAALERYLAYGSRVFGMLSQLPFPTAAAIHAAVLGGGLELAMHCDALIASPPPNGTDGARGKPYAIGLPEAGLAICPGWGGCSLLPARIDPAEAIRRTATGSPLTFDEAAAAGLFDEVAPSPAGLVPTAKAWVRRAAGRARVRRDGAPSRWAGRPAVAPAVLDALDSVRAEVDGTPSGQAVASAVDRGLSLGWKAAVAVERRELIRLRAAPAAKDAIAAFFARNKK